MSFMQTSDATVGVWVACAAGVEEDENEEMRSLDGTWSIALAAIS